MIKKRKLEEYSENDEFFYVYEPKRKSMWSNLNYAEKDENYVLDGINEEKSHKVKKLFDVCLRFVACNLECVENFIGFPSQVLEIIFKECIKIGKFTFDNENKKRITDKCLELFARAHPDLMANTLNLANESSTLFNLSNTLSYCLITELDLSNCELMFKCSSINLVDMLSSSMNTLEILNLSKNDLNNDFITKFTLPQRLDFVDFSKIYKIDLSGNYKLDQNCFKNFNKFQKLNEIILSIDNNKIGIIKINNKMEFRPCSCRDKTTTLNIKNDGWFAQLLPKNDEDSVVVQEKSEEKQTSVRRFYKRTIESYAVNKTHNEDSFTSVLFKIDCKCFKTLNKKETSSSIKNNENKHKLPQSSIDELTKLYS